MKNNHIYIAIDLKSFYTSVECVERQLDPMNTNLVVADASRAERTICLAVSPSLKSFGISGRTRLFEVVQKVREVNALRKSKAPYGLLYRIPNKNGVRICQKACRAWGCLRWVMSIIILSLF